MIRNLLLVLLIFISSACTAQTTKTNDRIDYVKNYNYKITIDIRSSFWSTGSKYVLDNSAIGFYDSIDAMQGRLKPLTLYYIPQSKTVDPAESNIDVVIPADTIEIRFSKEYSDKLFSLTRNFFRKLDFSDIDTLINGTKTGLVISDDASALIKLDFQGRQLYASISSINNSSISTKEFDELLNFIQRFNPTKK